MKVPWSRPESGFTLLFEAFTLALCKRMPVKSVTDMAGEHDTRIWRMVEWYVEKARSFIDMSHVNELGVDETSIKPSHHWE